MSNFGVVDLKVQISKTSDLEFCCKHKLFYEMRIFIEKYNFCQKKAIELGYFLFMQ